MPTICSERAFALLLLTVRLMMTEHLMAMQGQLLLLKFCHYRNQASPGVCPVFCAIHLVPYPSGSATYPGFGHTYDTLWQLLMHKLFGREQMQWPHCLPVP